jgi:uncharacterized protein YukE
MSEPIKKTFRQKRIEKGANLDAANADVEGEDGDVDGDPANDYRANSSKSKRKPSNDDDEQRSGDEGDVEDDTSGDTEPQVVTNGAGGYGDPALGDGSPDGDAASDNGSDDEDLNEGDVPVNKSADTGEEEVLTIVKAEDLMEGIHGMIHSEVQKAMANLQAMIPSAFAGAVAEAFRREINPVNNNIVMLSKAFEDLADHVDERLDTIDTDNEKLQKALSANVNIPDQGKPVHEPTVKSDTVRVPATGNGQTLKPEHAANTGSTTVQELRELVTVAKSLQVETGQKIEGLTDVTFAMESGSVSKALIETLKNSVTEIKKAHAV